MLYCVICMSNLHDINYMIISTPFCFPHVCPSLDDLQLPLQYLHVLLYALLNKNICNIGERKLTLHQLLSCCFCWSFLIVSIWTNFWSRKQIAERATILAYLQSAFHCEADISFLPLTPQQYTATILTYSPSTCDCQAAVPILPVDTNQ